MFASKSVKIRKIEINRDNELLCFDQPQRVMKPAAFIDFSRALDIVLGDRRKREEMANGESIKAEIEFSGKYFIIATQDSFVVQNEKEEVCTDSFLEMVEESEEGAYIRHFEDYKKETYPHKLRAYRAFVDDELVAFSKKTDGIGVTRTFRSYMSSFIRNFKPERLVSGKPFILYLNKKGEFCVENENFPGEHACLSENESTIYHYFCYLHLSEFWSEVAFMQNQHNVNLPLIVDDFLDYLDETEDTDALLNRATCLEREAYFSSRRELKIQG